MSDADLRDRILALPADHPGRTELLTLCDEVWAGVDLFVARPVQADMRHTLALWHELRQRWRELTGTPA